MLLIKFMDRDELVYTSVVPYGSRCSLLGGLFGRAPLFTVEDAQLRVESSNEPTKLLMPWRRGSLRILPQLLYRSRCTSGRISSQAWLSQYLPEGLELDFHC